MYVFTTELAALGPAGPDQRALFAALARRQDEADRFLGVLSGAVPLADYLAPRNLLRILGIRARAAAVA